MSNCFNKGILLLISLWLAVKRVACILVCSMILPEEEMDHRICIKFRLKNGKKESTVFEMLTVTFGTTYQKGP